MGQALSGVAGAESGFPVGVPAPQAGLQEAVPLLSGFIPDAPYSIAIDFVWPAHLRSWVARKLPQEPKQNP